MAEEEEAVVSVAVGVRVAVVGRGEDEGGSFTMGGVGEDIRRGEELNLEEWKWACFCSSALIVMGLSRCGGSVFEAAREIVCSAVVGVSSISEDDLMSIGIGSNSPLRLVERDKIVVDEGFGAGRGVGLADSLCASCAVSCAMSGDADKVLVWANWERREEGFCELDALLKLFVIFVPVLLWSGVWE